MTIQIEEYDGSHHDIAGEQRLDGELDLTDARRVDERDFGV